MKRRSRCEWMPMLPWPIWPLAGHARLGQNVVVGSMTILLSWLCWGASQEEVCLDPCFLCNLTPPRFSVELPGQGPVGKAQAVEDHTGHGFTWRDLLLFIGHKTCINHINEAYIFDKRGDQS